MNLVELVLETLTDRPLSGGALAEAIPLQRDAVLVYGALARLEADGRIRSLRAGPGEVIWGVGGSASPVPRAPGPPQSFRMGDAELASIEAAVWRLTEGLPGHYFEELRRTVVARADRLAYAGARPVDAARTALLSLGSPSSARSFLQKVQRGVLPPLRLRRQPRLRVWVWVVLLLLVALPLVLRLFVVGWYTLPAWQISMAPTLVPGVEGGDEVILADLVSYRWREPRRGEIVMFEANWEGEPHTYVKRILGLPGETISIRTGDVFVDGQRLIKERRLLDTVSVPLFGNEGFVRDDALPGFRQAESTHTGFRLPDGTVERRDSPAGDIILQATVRLGGLADSVAFLIAVGGKPRHQVVLTASGYESGVFVEGTAVAPGSPCQLQVGRDYRIWITNADRLFRVEMDGVEVARHAIAAEPGDPTLEIVLNGGGALARDLSLARDLTYETGFRRDFEMRLGADEYCVLGDNSPVSRDSRQMGPVTRDSIVGRAWRVVLPLRRARLLGVWR